MLLADTCEAAVRSIRPASREELKALIDRLIDERVADGELDESNLTFREVQAIKQIFMRVLEGVHHPRIKYPDAVKKSRDVPVVAEVETDYDPLGGEEIVEQPEAMGQG
jgi:membrane-associated HD superfamily phosphohydrolase